jgi:P4 family phage/plasmid primase-like protien
MTGGDTITARGLYAKSSVELSPSWTVFMPTNHKPIIKGSDNGIWRRMGLLPFERNFENDPNIPKDKGRREKLREEMPGILALLVRAALKYQVEGLEPPAKVKAARDAYRSQMDLLAEWLDVHCEISPGASARMSDLWDSWAMFASRNGTLPYIKSSTALGRRLDTRFPSRKGTGGVRERVGVALKTSENLF